MITDQLTTVTLSIGRNLKSVTILTHFGHLYTDKKENSHVWLIFGSHSSYMVKYLSISYMIIKPFLIYDFATDPIWISLYM